MKTLIASLLLSSFFLNLSPAHAEYGSRCNQVTRTIEDCLIFEGGELVMKKTTRFLVNNRSVTQRVWRSSANSNAFNCDYDQQGFRVDKVLFLEATFSCVSKYTY